MITLPYGFRKLFDRSGRPRLDWKAFQPPSSKVPPPVTCPLTQQAIIQFQPPHAGKGQPQSAFCFSAGKKKEAEERKKKTALTASSNFTSMWLYVVNAVNHRFSTLESCGVILDAGGVADVVLLSVIFNVALCKKKHVLWNFYHVHAIFCSVYL